jgi:hypothetical protein
MNMPEQDTPQSAAATIVPWVIVIAGLVALGAFVFGPFLTR